MNKSVNKCIFIGRLGKDPEYRENSNAKACNFSLACSDDYKDKQGNEVHQTNWINVVTFGRLAEICGQYLSKGSQIYIEGKYTTRTWTDNDNQKRYTTEIVASEMQMLDSRNDSQSPQKPMNAPRDNAVQNNFEDDMPF